VIDLRLLFLPFSRNRFHCERMKPSITVRALGIDGHEGPYLCPSFAASSTSHRMARSLGAVPMIELTSDELAAITDKELFSHDREQHGDPYMGLLKAKGMQRLALQSWHVGAARTKADRAALAEARRRLLQRLFPSDSVVVESKEVEQTGKAP
jgi:hypothetical protein